MRILREFLEDIDGLFVFDIFNKQTNKNNVKHLSKFDVFFGKDIELVMDINDEPLDGMVIVRNIRNEDLNDKVRFYSVYLDGNDIVFNLSKDSLKIYSQLGTKFI